MSIIKIFGPIDELKGNEQTQFREFLEKECSSGLLSEDILAKHIMGQEILDRTKAFLELRTAWLKSEYGYDLFICLYYSNGAKTYTSHYKANLEGRELQVIFFDCKLIYEVLAYLVFSPLSRNNPPIDGALSIFNLALAGRLNATKNETLHFLSMSLVGQASIGDIDIGLDEKTSIFLNDLIISSKVPYEDNDQVVNIVCNFILNHELAHFLLKQDTSLKESTEHNLRHIVSITEQFFGSERRPLDQHRTKLWNGLKEMLDSNDPFAQLDLEECSCDLVAISNTIKSTKFDGDTIPLLRACIGFTLQVINLNLGFVKYYSTIREEINNLENQFPAQEFSGNAGEDIYDNALALRTEEIFTNAGQKLHNTQLIHGYRQIIVESYADVMLNLEIQELLDEGHKTRSYSFLSNGNYHNTQWANFSYSFNYSLHSNLISSKNISDLLMKERYYKAFFNDHFKTNSSADPFYSIIIGP